MVRRCGAVVAVLVTLGSLAACSSDDKVAPELSNTTMASATTGPIPPQGSDPGRRPCHPTPTASRPVTVDAVDGIETDRNVTSFDGTQIRTHWFPNPSASESSPVPTVLMGPGWSLGGDTNPDGAVAFGVASINGLHEAGYNVFTWDPRGFGASGGEAGVNDPTKEGRDVQVLLDWVAEQDEALLDGDLDPRVGMIGLSYGGGIQLTVAAIDCRVDAIVPGWAWNSLGTGLYRADTVKLGWAEQLVAAAANGNLDPHIPRAIEQARATGKLEPEEEEWFLRRGPSQLISAIDIPTLFIQGTVDTLFTLDEAAVNFLDLQSRGIPTAMVWVCAGHGTCLTAPGDEALANTSALAWFRRHLDEDTSAPEVPTISAVDNEGVTWVGSTFPPAAGPEVIGRGSGSLQLTTASVTGPIVTRAQPGILDQIVSNITPGPATEAVDVAIRPGDVDVLAIGRPRVRLRYHGTTPADERPLRVFGQIVDEATGVVVGSQITPIPVILDGEEHETEVQLEVIVQHLRADSRLKLQLVATTPVYALPQLGGEITFDEVTVQLPTTTSFTARP